MSQFTAGIQLPLISDGVGGGTLHNEALAVLDLVYGQGVEARQDDAPASPVEQTAYVIGTPTLGDAWDGHDNEIAVYLNGTWNFYVASQGVRTWDRATNKALVMGSAGWHYATGIAAWFARLSTAHAYSGTAADSVNGWTEMIEQPGSNVLWNHNPTAADDGRLELVEGGLYWCSFSGVVIPATAADTYRIGFGVNSTTPTTGGFSDFAIVAADLTAPRAFHVEMIRSFSAGDDLYVTCDKQTAAGGTLTFVDESCKWSVLKLGV